MTECDFILSVEVIPSIKPTISSSNEEETGSGGWPATIRQVSRMITSSNDLWLGILIPDLDWPITDGHEELWLEGISLQSNNRTVMSGGINTESGEYINRLLGSLVNTENRTLFGTDEVFRGLFEWKRKAKLLHRLQGNIRCKYHRQLFPFLRLR